MESSSSESKYVGTKGSVICDPLQPGHLLVTLIGHDDGDLASFIIKRADIEITKSGFIVLYCDTRQQVSSSAKAREEATAWIRGLGGRFRGCHLLCKSKVMEMTFALIRMVTGAPLRSYSDVAAFERAISSAIPGFKGLAPRAFGRDKAAP